MQFSDTLQPYSGAFGSDKITHHSYGEIYNKEIGRLESLEDVRILEIGIMSGAFLQAVAEHLPHANVYGMDISLDLLYPRWNWDHPRIHTVCMDGTTPEAPSAVQGPFDLIVEDASHRPHDQVASLRVFAPHLKPGGTYVIEDINQEHAQWLQPELERAAQEHGLEMEWMDLRSVKGRFDDIVAIFRRQS